MLLIFILGLCLTFTADVVQGKCKPDYLYSRTAAGWMKKHQELATFDEAQLICSSEHAQLMSPLTDGQLEAMTSSMGNHTYYTDMTTRILPGQFKSFKNVSLENMPVINITEHLDTRVCLSMNRESLQIEMCDKPLPFICFKTHNNKNTTICGTSDSGYRHESSTGSCYKLHTDLMTWGDASAVCNFEGGYLAVINSPEEGIIIKNMFPQNINLPNRRWTAFWDPLFLGFRDWNQDDNWLTVQGECLELNWHKDEPRANSQQYCGAMIRTGELEATYCDSKSFFVCERDLDSIMLQSSAKKLNYVY